ncbi:hypothetical protein HY950_00725, partial [Candidatus Gottesmanbacteria bacterium]|nr:hypothetical protein [Candidatus Gottesmanbacteria bacterium]
EAKKRIYIILQKSSTKHTKVQQDEIAEKAAVAAVKYAMLKVGAAGDIAFDLEKSVSFEGDSGPYLQYTYARCRSVLRKANTTVIARSSASRDDEAISKSKGIAAVAEDGSLAMTMNPEERSLARLIGQFPDVVGAAAANFAPNTICTYLFHLAQAFNLFYAKHQILARDKGQETGDKKTNASDLSPVSGLLSLRLALTASTAQVLANGLYLLGIETLEQM